MSSVERSPFSFGGEQIAAGRRRRLELPTARLVSGTQLGLPALVLHGSSDGPVVWLSAAVHGDEIGGVEIIRLVLGDLDPTRMAGTVIALPIMNVHGFNTGDRYLPDGRDLNRSFPGSPRGSLAGRIAHLITTEVVRRCDVGLDLHTGARQRTNLPQVRGDLDDAPTRALADAFGAPVALHARVRDGSLRQAAAETGTTVLLYEGGEASRFDRAAIEAGADGVRRALAHLGVATFDVPSPGPVIHSRSSRWERAGSSGILHLEHPLGATVAAGELVGTLYDPFGERRGVIRARQAGLIIGQTRTPLVNRGDAVVHVAQPGREPVG